MSDVGLNSNIYDISSRYLEILNRFLVEANYDSTSVAPELTDELQFFLQQLSNVAGRDFQIQMVAQIISGYLQKHASREKPDIFLRNLFAHLDAGTITDKDALRRISVLADALDEECDASFSRIRLRK